MSFCGPKYAPTYYLFIVRSRGCFRIREEACRLYQLYEVGIDIDGFNALIQFIISCTILQSANFSFNIKIAMKSFLW